MDFSRDGFAGHFRPDRVARAQALLRERLIRPVIANEFLCLARIDDVERPWTSLSTIGDRIAPRCTCPDFVFEEALCHHVIALHLLARGDGLPQAPALSHVRVLDRAGLSVSIRSGIDWFDVTGHVSFDGRKVPLGEALKMIARSGGIVELEPGLVALMPAELLRQRQSLWENGSLHRNGVVLSRAHLLLLEQFARQPFVTTDDGFRRLAGRVAGFERLKPADADPGFPGVLRRYQREGLAWFLFLRDFGFGGCLADDMGLGKTVQALALLHRLKREGALGQSLLVVPLSIVFNWFGEADRFAPGLRLAEYRGPEREAVLGDPAIDLVVTTYATLGRDADRLAGHRFDYLILDESQHIKNPYSRRAKAARGLHAGHRLILTGTPVENSLADLWSQFAFINPGLLPDFRTFGRRYLRQPDPDRIEELKRRIRPFILRRTKGEVALELPPRTDHTVWCEMTERQREMYDTLRLGLLAGLHERIEAAGLPRSRMNVLEALLRLRQICCHPDLIAPEAGIASGKFVRLEEIVSELLAEGHKVLIFSQFVRMLSIMRRRLHEEGIDHEYLDGATVHRDRAVARFNREPGCRIFLVSLKAGGFGLNLTAADHVVVYDPWWNPAVEEQAFSRAHRIGQRNPVICTRMVTRESVEERILDLHRRKRGLAGAVLAAGAGLFESLTREDIEYIFA